MQYNQHTTQQHQAASAAHEPVASTSSTSHYAARPTAASPPESDHYDQRDAPINGHARPDAAQSHHHDPPRRGSGGADIPITPVHGPGARDAAYSHPAYSSSSLYTSGLVTGPGGHAMFPGAGPSSSSSGMTRPGAAYPPPGHVPPYAGRYAAPSAAAGDDSSRASEWR
ncbi:RHTO0S09e00892g1_1 [Rhodotorula toruloides]|uniref:RHTO0S09e00892g1_1 n=2 Tax=Rhodotorula toruloides TaxID=5286 RepID=A0A061B2L9_RHOTO|nr:RHTO0S09e00892g1_1 [Rhodotorula toruloides]